METRMYSAEDFPFDEVKRKSATTHVLMKNIALQINREVPSIRANVLYKVNLAYEILEAYIV